jgi:hypothetical protein
VIAVAVAGISSGAIAGSVERTLVLPAGAFTGFVKRAIFIVVTVAVAEIIGGAVAGSIQRPILFVARAIIAGSRSVFAAITV